MMLRLKLWAAAFLAAIAAALGLFLTGKRRGAQEVKAKQAEATIKAVQRGAEGAAEATAALRKGKTPQEVKDGNDKAWR
jgi:hypothetical protein